MAEALERRLVGLLDGSPLASRLPGRAARFFELHSKDGALDALPDDLARGLARVLAVSGESSRYLAHREGLLARLRGVGPDALARRAREIAADRLPEGTDLETALDLLRLRRRDETTFAACVELAGQASRAETSSFLSRVAEWCLARSLELAERRGPAPVAVIGMGKIAGRELTYHSDLDIIFLHEGEDALVPARLAQRVIAYLSTMTGAGVCYEVDSRLRPSGRQGTLVTELGSFERYQTERAASWEHLALMRARAIAGAVGAAQDALDRTRARVIERSSSPWAEIATMRARVESERVSSRNPELAFKTGRGGLMDVEFLAKGAALHAGAALGSEVLPSIQELLLRLAPRESAAALLEDYELLRLLEARVRLVSGRAVESLPLGGETPELVAALIEPGGEPDVLARRVDAACERIRAAFDRVVDAGSIEAL